MIYLSIAVIFLYTFFTVPFLPDTLSKNECHDPKTECNNNA